MVRRLRSEFDFHQLVLHSLISKRLSKSYSNHWNLDHPRSCLPKDNKRGIFLDEDDVEMFDINQQAILDSILHRNVSHDKIHRQHHFEPQTHQSLSRRSLLDPIDLSDVTVIPIIFEKGSSPRDKNIARKRPQAVSPIIIDYADAGVAGPASPLVIDDDMLLLSGMTRVNSNNNHASSSKDSLQLPIIVDDKPAHLVDTNTVELSPLVPSTDSTASMSTEGYSYLSKNAETKSKTAVDEYTSKVKVDPAPNYPIYDILRKQLAKEERLLDYVRGDGNCFFRALSKLMYGTDTYHKAVRTLVVDLVATNKDKFAQFVDGEDVQTHIERMSEDHCWATTCEIYAAATLFQKDIYMYTPNHSNDKYSWLLFRPVFKRRLQATELKSSPCCYVTLCNTNGNHYDRVVPNHGSCNCFLPQPQLDGVYASVDLTDS